MNDEATNEELFLKAYYIYDAGDFSTALELFSQLSELGDSSSQNYLGIMYGEGQGVKKDDVKSLFYHKLAARTSKSPFDWNNVARQYEIMGNRRRALYWWNKANAAGDKGAALQLAKRLLQNQRSDSRKRAITLLQFTASGNPPMDISEDEQEEALDLLDELEA